jgi:putative SOS response-associated peptidase YedK
MALHWMEPYHDRMPVLLALIDFGCWLGRIYYTP